MVNRWWAIAGAFNAFAAGIQFTNNNYGWMAFSLLGTLICIMTQEDKIHDR